jgi:hypothetical protein
MQERDRGAWGVRAPRALVAFANGPLLALPPPRIEVALRRPPILAGVDNLRPRPFCAHENPERVTFGAEP